MTDTDPLLAPFEALIGAWATEAKHRLMDVAVFGTTTFEWLEGRAFVVQRSTVDHELFPDALAVIGPPEAGEGLVLESFDSRGVRRTYETSLQDGVWRMWRDHPGFDQRMTATVAHDELVSVVELAGQPGAWVEDMRVIYRRRG